MSPCAGQLTALSEVNDPVFNSYTVGDGIAVTPANAGEVTVCAPCSGKAIRVMPHAFVILTEEKTGILVHVGIDTVQLKGEGFDVLVEQGCHVDMGQAMVRYTPQEVADKGLDPVVLIVAMDSARGDAQLTKLSPGDKVETGAPLFHL
ncbi:PTS sugar transporter subunit IIA [Corynebacterium aquilae]|nr:PTS glucose transporter subunit IIA [Corynebacterium aquilae]